MTIIIGRISASWCPHCQNGEEGFKNIKTILKEKYNDNITFKEFKTSDNELSPTQLDELNEIQSGKTGEINNKGFPSHFIINDAGKIENYNKKTDFNDKKDAQTEFIDWVKENTTTTRGRRHRRHRRTTRRSQRGGYKWISSNKSKSSRKTAVKVATLPQRSRTKTRKNTWFF